MIFSKIPDISLTAVKYPDISRFSRQVVTMLFIYRNCRKLIRDNLTVMIKVGTVNDVYFQLIWCRLTQLTHADLSYLKEKPLNELVCCFVLVYRNYTIPVSKLDALWTIASHMNLVSLCHHIITSRKSLTTSKNSDLVITLLLGSSELCTFVLVLRVEVLMSAQFSFHIVIIFLHERQMTDND